MASRRTDLAFYRAQKLIAGDADTLKALAAREGLTSRVAFLPRLIEEAPRYVAFPKDRADGEALRFSGTPLNFPPQGRRI